MSNVNVISEQVHALVLAGVQENAESRQEVRPDAVWRKIRDTGTELWLDTGVIDEAS